MDDVIGRAKNRLKTMIGGNYHSYIDNHLAGDFAVDLFKALEQPQQEPAAWVVSANHGIGERVVIQDKGFADKVKERGICEVIPLYTHSSNVRRAGALEINALLDKRTNKPDNYRFIVNMVAEDVMDACNIPKEGE